MNLFFCKGPQEETKGLGPATLEGHGFQHCHNDDDLGKSVPPANLDTKKVWFRVQRVGCGTSQEPACVMVDGKEYGFTMNRKNAGRVIAIYQAKLSALKVAFSPRGKPMVTEDEDTEGS